MDGTPAIRTAIILLLGIGAIASGGIGVYVLKERNGERTLKAFAITCLATSTWAGTYLVRILSNNETVQIFFMVCTYIGITITPTAFLVFALYYTGNEKLVTRKAIGVLSIHPIAVMVLLITNSQHGLFYESIQYATPTLAVESGVLFWPHVAYSYTLILSSLGLLGYFAATANDLYRIQSALLFIGVLVPLSVNVPFFLGIEIVDGLDPTPVALSLSMVAIGGSVFHGRLIELVPVARATVIDSLNEGIIVLNDNYQIIDVNPKAAAFLGKSQHELTGKQNTDVLPQPIQTLLDSELDVTEWEHNTPEGNEYYRVKHEQITSHGVRGHVITITNITEPKQQRLRLERQNEKLDRSASVVSHDLRSPLTLAKGYIGKIDKRYEGDQQHVDKVD